MNIGKQSGNSNKFAILPMWVIDRIKEEMRLGPAAWQAITDAVEQAEVPQALPCEVKLPPGTVLGQGSPLTTLLMAIAQRASQPAHAQVFGSEQEVQQPHPEPIAWMVGTAFWWTKEEAERDAAATGLPIVGLGPMIDTGAIDQLSQIIRDLNDERDEIGAEVGRLRAQLAELEALHGGELGLPKEGWPEYHKRKMETLRGLTAGYYQRKLAERDTLIDEVLKAFQLNADGNGSCHNPGLSFIRPWAERVAALSASAEPRATTPQTINGHKLNCKAVDDYKPGQCSCGVEINHGIPGTSFQRLNTLANQGE